MDRYFFTIPTLKTLNALNGAGAVRLEIVTRTKKSCTVFEKPAPGKFGRGHPIKKGRRPTEIFFYVYGTATGITYNTNNSGATGYVRNLPGFPGFLMMRTFIHQS